MLNLLSDDGPVGQVFEVVTAAGTLEVTLGAGGGGSLPPGTYSTPLVYDAFGAQWIAGESFSLGENIHPFEQRQAVFFDVNGVSIASDLIPGLSWSWGIGVSGHGYVVQVRWDGGLEVVQLGFFDHTPAAQQTVTGATTQEQVDSLIAALAAYGLIVDGR